MYIDIGDLLAIVSLILGIVALLITLLGFFASLKFYKDGLNLQDKANSALAKIEEKTASIQTQIGGMFDKTLDAAINNNKGNLVARDFEDIHGQLDKARQNLVKQVENEITSIAEGEKQKLEEILNEQFRLIEDQVNISQENTEDLINQSDAESSPITQSQLKILNALRTSKSELSGAELSEKLDLSHLVLARDLDRLKRKKLILEKSFKGLKKYSLANFGGNKLEILVNEAFERASEFSSEPHISKLGLEIRKIDPSFHPRKYGFYNLSELLCSQEKYEVLDNYVNGLNHPTIKRK